MVSRQEAEIQAHLLYIRRWKARLIVCCTMLLLALVGLLIMDIHPRSYWLYSRVMALLYASLSIWLFWYLNRGNHKLTTSTLWHQLLHWFGLLIASYLVSIFVNTGLMGSLQAGFVTLTLLALTIFLAGVYSNFSFMLIGLTLAVFAAAAAMIEAYLSLVMIPVIIVVGIIIYWVSHHEKKKTQHAHEE